MEQEAIDKLLKSGKINKKAQEYAKKIIQPGKTVFEVGTKIDEFIKEQGAFPAWPVNLSLNHQAAHNSYSEYDEIIITEDDVLKVDVGVSIDGYVSDSAQTIIFNKKHEKLKEASESALLASKKYLEENYKTAKICDIGEIIDTKIKEFGFKPISNLTGHYMGKYKVHDFPSIPNVPNDLEFKFTEFDSNFAIEPFSSTGNGFVNEGPVVYIFEFIEDRAIRNANARKLLDEVKTFNNLPFSETWIGKDMSNFDKKIALRELLKNEIIAGHPVLVDKNGSYVSQAETSFIITKDGLIDLVELYGY